MLLEIFGSVASGLFHKLGLKLGDSLIRQQQEKHQKSPKTDAPDSTVSDQEAWNIVTSHGRYKEVWSIYRTNGFRAIASKLSG
jgi:hypothetical protein